MSFTQGIRTANILTADQAVTSSVTPVTIQNSSTDQFSFVVNAGKTLYWEFEGIFSLGATGGFRFLPHCSSAPTKYNFECTVRDLTTPGTLTPASAGVLTETAFANASAVAGNYQIQASGSIIANAQTTFSFQFAQNTSDVLSITMKAGAVLKLWQL